MHIGILSVFLIAICATTILAESRFTYINSVSLESNATRREIRLHYKDANTWTYAACVADSGLAEEARVSNVYINANELSSYATVQNYYNYFEYSMIQGQPYCSFAGRSDTTLFSQTQPPVDGTIPDNGWKSPLFSVWSKNEIQFFLTTGVRIVNYLNATTPGSFDYSVANDNMEQIMHWELYREFISACDTFYMSISLGHSNGTWAVVVYKCDSDCVRENNPIVNGAYSTITANGTHWFSCYKQVTSSTNQVIQSGQYACKHSGDSSLTYYPSDIDAEYPVSNTKNNPMYSCVVGNTTMILAVSSSTDNTYTLYGLDTSNGFSLNGKSAVTVNRTVESMDCMDQIVLVTTRDSADYWIWDNGSGFSFPNVPVSMFEPLPNDTVVVSPAAGVTQPSTVPSGTTADEDKVLVGVLVGVGVPVIAGVIVLIVLRKRLRKNKTVKETNPTYTSINLPSRESQYFEKKMFIQFKQLKFTKEIGSGSFGKVFLGKWQGNEVAIKKNNRAANTTNFLAEAKLTLYDPSLDITVHLINIPVRSMPPHPNLVQTFGVCTDSDNSYIVLEYCEGGSLDKIVFNQTLNNTEQRALVLGIAHGLAHLHRHNIVHRDLAVRNILLKEGVPKISDFGMSRVLKEEASQGKTATTIGPIRWMAPESVLDMSYSYKSDVWTFGIVVSEIVNGHEPHEGENQLDVAMQIREEGYTPSLPDECDPVLLELMQMCWRMNPDDRPSMNDLVVFLNHKLGLN